MVLCNLCQGAPLLTSTCLWYPCTKLSVSVGVLEVVHKLHYFILGLLHASYVSEAACTVQKWVCINITRELAVQVSVDFKINRKS